MTATTPVLDNFNRADTGPPPSANWTTIVAGAGGLKVVSNVCAGNSTNNVGYWSAQQWNADEEVYATVTVKPGNNNSISLYVRLKDVGSAATMDGYLLFLLQQAGTDIIRIQRLDNGVVTTLGADISQEIAVNDKYLLRVIGSTLEAWRWDGSTWTLLGTRTDSTYAAGGYVGAGISGTTGRIDDFGGGNHIPVPVITMPAYKQARRVQKRR